jgi:hypothetical protein
MPSAVKITLEDLLRTRQLQADAPPLRGQDRRLTRLGTGMDPVDALLGGGFPRGQVSEVHGLASSGRTGLVLALCARTTSGGSLAAWVDPGDHLDPASAAEAGVDLTRLLWLRGQPRSPRNLADAVSGASTVLGSGLFDVVVLDLVGVTGPELGRLPHTTWIRFHRLIEDSPTAFVLLADGHVAQTPGGLSLSLSSTGARWSGSGPGRLLRGLGGKVRAGRHGLRAADLELKAFHCD